MDNRTLEPRDEMVRQRVAGAAYTAIALLHGVSISLVRYVCRAAMQRGQVTAEQIRHRPVGKREPLPDGVYTARWMERVQAKCIVNDRGCWVWQGFCHTKGYGGTNFRGRNIAVHRAMYMVVHGVKLRTEQLVCHSCDNPPCCNPDHLWLGDAKSNSDDSVSKGRHHNQLRTHCPRGHELTPENTYYPRKPNKSGIFPRGCKFCGIVRSRLKLGWTEEEAESQARVPRGYSRTRLPVMEQS